jgi:hypothetical protein
MQKYQDAVQRTNGQAVVGASVAVQTYPAGVAATIYSDNSGTVATNPLTTDSLGNFSFYAPNGRYQLVISGTGITTRTQTDIELYDEVSLSDYGAVGDGVTNDSAAVQLALTAGTGGSVYVPEGIFMVSGLIVPADTYVYGPGTLKKRANGAVISTMGVHASLYVNIDGNGANFTGRGVVVDDGGAATITTAWWRSFQFCEITDTESYCIEFVNDSDGYLSEMIGGTYTRYNNTGASVKFPATETNGNRRMIGVMCFANPIADLGGADNTLIMGCEGSWPIFSSTTKKARVIGNRIAGTGGGTLNGSQNVITGNAVGDTTLTLGASLSGSVVSGNMFATPLAVTDSTVAAAANDIYLPRATYTPTWTGGSPTIGNGTINGSYVFTGDTCKVSIQLTMGSTTTYGAGAWSFSLPKAAAARDQAGSAYIEDSSVPAVYSATTYIQSSASTVRVAVAGSTAAYLGSATPFAWATGDKVMLEFDYIIG